MAIRLIDTETLRMKMFIGTSTPPYAILSHTWIEGEEVDFQEMTRYGAIPRQDDPSDSRRRDCRCSCHCDCCSGAAATDTTADDIRRRSGYQKIIQTCRLAKERGLKWAWVDTCCIDKSSSAELSEAVNSMFKWYKNSKECYAFLFDLEPAVDELDPKEALGRCRWFTRGWTLQELIAPVELQFYNRAWENIGSRKSLQTKLAGITGVDESVLASGSGSLRDWNVATKMFWASRRQTTRTEDMAYCLLGLFEINMPLLYGEGDKAFRRLQEEILKRVDDDSIFYTSAPGVAAGGPARDMLAISPAQFRWKCAPLDDYVVTRRGRATFTMTSRGLLVQKPCLLPYNRPLVEEPFYVLEMDYMADSPHKVAGDGAVVLRMIRHGEYMRQNTPRLTETERIQGWRRHCLLKARHVEDFFIVSPDSIRTSLGSVLDSGYRLCLELEPASPLINSVLSARARQGSGMWPGCAPSDSTWICGGQRLSSRHTQDFHSLVT